MHAREPEPSHAVLSTWYLLNAIRLAQRGARAAPREQHPQLVHEIEELLRRKKRAILVDLGCGASPLAAALAAEYPTLTVIGVDNDERVIAAAQDIFGKQLLENLSFTTADARAVCDAIPQADIVISIQSLHHFDNVDEIMKELCELLNDKGSLYIRDFERQASLLSEIIATDGMHRSLNDILNELRELSEQEFARAARALILAPEEDGLSNHVRLLEAFSLAAAYTVHELTTTLEATGFAQITTRLRGNEMIVLARKK